MKCPVCTNVNLVMSERQGVEIDYCPQCRGVWLDRGELDKVIERSLAQEPTAVAQPSYSPQPPPSRGGHDQGYNYGHGNGHGHKPYRKKSLLEQLFD